MDLPIQPNDQIQDPLTGVYTRASLNWRLPDEVERARRYGQTLSLLLLDLDHFKSINDAFGHTRGDQVLVEFVQRLRAGIRGSDLIFRYGGDEFVLLLPHTDKPHAVLLAQRLLARVGSVPFVGEPPLSLSLSIGVANFPLDGQTSEELFEIADQRNYEAKRAGRGRVVSGEPFQSEARPLIEPSRLIERDQAVETVRRLLSSLPEHRRSLLQVIGPAGSGKSRFLAEVGKAARLRGYGVLALSGKPALKDRVYGVLDEARREWEGLPLPSTGTARFIAALQQMVRDRGCAGLFVCMDDLPDVDQPTLDFVRNLFTSATVPQLALVYAAGTPNIPGGLPQAAPVRESVTLAPISLAGLRIWIRHGLQWEAPAPFAEWFHRETGGRPDFIRRGLAFLIEQEVLKQAEGGWVCRPDFATFPLAAELARQPASPRHNLPPGLKDFVGREEEIQRLKRLIREQRLVAVLGPDGVGKTRLALQTAAESLESFPHGVYFVSLTSLSSADFLASAVADALDFSLSGPHDPQTQLLDYLRGKEVLLVLDNFEHPQVGAPLWNEILGQAPGVKLLVTSRDRTALPREVPFESERAEPVGPVRSGHFRGPGFYRTGPGQPFRGSGGGVLSGVGTCALAASKV